MVEEVEVPDEPTTVPPSKPKPKPTEDPQPATDAKKDKKNDKGATSNRQMDIMSFFKK